MNVKIKDIDNVIRDIKKTSIPIDSCDACVWEKKWEHLKDLITHLR